MQQFNLTRNGDVTMPSQEPRSCEHAQDQEEHDLHAPRSIGYLRERVSSSLTAHKKQEMLEDFNLEECALCRVLGDLVRVRVNAAPS